MSYRVLHVLDTYLPETMNWLDALLQSTYLACDHHIAARYWIKGVQSKFTAVPNSTLTDYPVSIKSKIVRVLTDFTTLRKLSDYIESASIDIIHFHFANTAIRHYELIQSTSKTVLISFYGYDYEYLVKKNSNTLVSYLNLAKCGAKFIVEGEYSKKLLANYGIPNTQIFKLHMLFPRTGFSRILDFKTPLRLIQSASFTEKKNQLAFLESLHDRHVARLQVLLIGEIVDKHYFKEIQLVLKTKIKHDIQILDKLPTAIYLQQLSGQHFSINLSKRSRSYDTEGGCPVFIRDSLVLGKPVISTMHCDIPESVVHGFNGYLTKADDIQAISECLDMVLRLNQKLYSQLCINAYHTVQANALNNLTGQELLQIYSQSYEDSRI